MRPVGIGLAGLGRWGRNYMKTLLGLPECALVAVADPDPAARAAATGMRGVAVYRSAAELLSNPAIAAVIIATPDHTHYSLSTTALQSGRDVLVEKPMTLTAAEAETLVSRADGGNRVLAVGHTAVYSSDLESLRVRLQSIACVRDRRVRAERTSSGPPSGQPPSANRHSSILFDLCPHDIALAILLFGTPTAARARSGERTIEYEVRFQGDELLEGRAEWREPPHVRRFEIAGTEKTAGDLTSVPDCRDVRRTPLGRQCLDFIQSCRTRRQPLSSGRLGLSVVRCLAALGSSRADGGAWVQFPEEARMTNVERRGSEPASGPIEVGARA